MDQSDKINKVEKDDDTVNVQASIQVQQTQDSIKATLERSKKLSLNLEELSSRWEVMNSTMNHIDFMTPFIYIPEKFIYLKILRYIM